MVLLDKELLPSDLTFGIELECIGNKATEFIESNPTDFLVERDSSLDDENGIEFISPIMRYSGEYLYNIKDTLDFIKSNGFKVDETCGGHIHYGASYLETLGTTLNLLVLYKYFEKELCAISNGAGERIRKGCSTHASSISSIIRDVEYELKNEKMLSTHSIDDSKKIKDGAISKRKSYGLNIRNIGNPDKNTVEFRVPNGTLDNDTLKENIVLFGSLIKSARTIFDFYEFQLEINNMLSKKNKEGKRFDLLMNILFEDENLKGLYYKRYEENINDPMLNNLGMEETTLRNYPTIKKILNKKR